MSVLIVPFFAEVSDKMNTWPELVSSVVLISIAGIITLRKRSWLAVIPGLFSVLWTWSAYDILTDRFMRPAVIAELGLPYILIEFIPIALFTIFSLIEIKKGRTRHTSQRRETAWLSIKR